MKIKELASWLTKKNKKKSESTIGNTREDLANLCDLIFKEGEPIRELATNKMIGVQGDTLVELWKNGQRRAVRKNK